MPATRFAIALLPLLATAAFAQTPSAAPAPADLSAQGATALAKFKQGDPVSKQLYGQFRAAQAQIQLEAQRPVINFDLFSSLIRKADSFYGQFRSHQSDLLIQALKGLSEADRPAFLRAAGLAGKGAGTPPTTAPTH